MTSHSSCALRGRAAPAPVAAREFVRPGIRADRSAATSFALRRFPPIRAVAVKVSAMYARMVAEPTG